MGLDDGLVDQAGDCFTSFIEQRCKIARVAVDAKRQLGQIVAADRKPVETRRELLGKDDVRRDLAHHVDFEVGAAPSEPIFRHHFQHTIRLCRCPAERHHDDDIAKADVLANTFQRATFKRKAFAIAFIIIARGAPEPEHRIFFVRLEGGSAQEMGILIRLEVAQPHDHGIWVVNRGDLGDAKCERLDEEFGRIGKPRGQRANLAQLGSVGDALGVQQGHRMRLDRIADDELHTG